MYLRFNASCAEELLALLLDRTTGAFDAVGDKESMDRALDGLDMLLEWLSEHPDAQKLRSPVPEQSPPGEILRQNAKQLRDELWKTERTFNDDAAVKVLVGVRVFLEMLNKLVSAYGELARPIPEAKA